MRTLPLRQLLRDPKKVKQFTKDGQTVRITDGGEPLWDIAAPGGVPGSSTQAASIRTDLWEEHFEELLSSAIPPDDMPSLSDVLAASRGDR